MTEEQQLPAKETDAASRALTPGELLRHERERLGRTVQEFAEEMHLGAHMIEAMESNRFSVLGAPVFARGHLRKYATLLGVSVDRVQKLYEAVSDRPTESDPVPVIHRATEPSIPMSPDSHDRRGPLQPAQWALIVAGGALVLVILLAWIFVGRSQEQQSTEIAAAPAEVAAPEAEIEIPAAASPGGQPAAVSSTPSAPIATTPSAPAVRPAPATRRKVSLRFAFTQESWVEVYDARGTRLLYDVGQPGQSRSVDVDPPAQVVLGMASGVNTEVNGAVVEVPARRISSQVAKFTVQPDGSVQ
jgi:cytoskeleton protein RodZ